MIFKIKYERQGGHTHMGIWAGEQAVSLGKCGDLCMTNAEFILFRDALSAASDTAIVDGAQFNFVDLKEVRK